MCLRSVCVNRAEGSRSFIVMTVLFSCLKINNTSSDYWNYFFDNVPSQYLSWHWLKYLLPHDISEPIDFTTLCQPSSHLPAYIHYLLTFLKWVATFNSQCRVFRLLHTSSGTALQLKTQMTSYNQTCKLTYSFTENFIITQQFFFWPTSFTIGLLQTRYMAFLMLPFIQTWEMQSEMHCPGDQCLIQGHPRHVDRKWWVSNCQPCNQ